jgi:hypothetical protein
MPTLSKGSIWKAGGVSDLDPKQVVASFDSASVLHAATADALEGQPFPNLGSSALAGLAVRAAGRLPWSLLRGIYTRIWRLGGDRSSTAGRCRPGCGRGLVR